jgi:hypothetical protein
LDKKHGGKTAFEKIANNIYLNKDNGADSDPLKWEEVYYILNKDLITSMHNYFNSLTKGYNKVLPDSDNITNAEEHTGYIIDALKYARYIDIIKILKEKNDYEVGGEFMKNAINDYIEDGEKGALEYIKKININNEYVKKLKKQKEQKEQKEKEKKELWMA